MASVNKVQIIGNLGRDPESRTFPNGDLVTNISVATTEKWKDKQTGEQKEATEWHRISFTGRLAEIASQYLRQGSSVYVEGSLRTRKWTDQQGVDRYTTEIRASSLQLLGRPQGEGAGQGGGHSGHSGHGGDGNAPRSQQRQQPPQQGQGHGGYDRQAQRQQQPQQPQQPQQRQQAPAQGGGGGSSGFDDWSDDIPFATSDFSFDAESRLDRRIRRSNRTRHE